MIRSGLTSIQNNLLKSVYSLIAIIFCVTGCDYTQELPEKNSHQIIESEILRKNGNELIERGKAQEAVILFDKLIKTDPRDSLAYNGKAVAFDHTGNHLAAQDIYKTALSLDPDSIMIKNNMAMSLILNNQAKQAISILEPLVTNATSDVSKSIYLATMHHNLALAYGITEQYAKAKKLNLRYMSEDQAQENEDFYKRYVAGINKITDKTKPENSIGFITTPQPKKTDFTKNNEPKEKTEEENMFMGNKAVYTYPN